MRWLLLALVVAGAARGVLAVERGIPWTETRRHRVAAALAESGRLAYCNSYFPFCGPGNDATASVAPVPILAFAGLMRLAGPGPGAVAAVVVQTVLGFASVLLVFGLGKRWVGDPRGAWTAAVLWGIYAPAAELELYLNAEPWFVPLVLGALVFADRGLHEESGARSWALSGALFGLGALSRTALLYFPPALALFGLLLPPGGWRPRLLRSLALMVGFAVVLAPWVARNAIVFDAFVPGGTLTGYNLYRHNHRLGSPKARQYASRRVMEKATRRLIRQHRDELRGDENEVEMDRFYRREAMQIIREHPRQYLALSGWRLIVLVTNYGFRPWSSLSLLARLWPVENVLLFLALGVAVVRRRAWRPGPWWPFLALLGYTILGHALVNGLMRYLVPLMGGVMILATAAVLPIGGEDSKRPLVEGGATPAEGASP